MTDPSASTSAIWKELKIHAIVSHILGQHVVGFEGYVVHKGARGELERLDMLMELGAGDATALVPSDAKDLVSLNRVVRSPAAICMD